MTTEPILPTNEIAEMNALRKGHDMQKEIDEARALVKKLTALADQAIERAGDGCEM